MGGIKWLSVNGLSVLRSIMIAVPLILPVGDVNRNLKVRHVSYLNMVAHVLSTFKAVKHNNYKHIFSPPQELFFPQDLLSNTFHNRHIHFELTRT